MKLGQLIEYNMKNIFLEESYTNMVEKLFSDAFLKNRIERISGSIVCDFIQPFLWYAKLRNIEIY